MRVHIDNAARVTLDLVVIDCADCGVVFAITKELERRRQADHGTLFCPNGHSLSYDAETKAEKELREQKELNNRLSKRLEWAQSDAEREAEARKAAENSLRTTKGHVTRLHNRVDAGLCPYPGCRRHFTDLERHIATKHAGEPLVTEQESAP